MNYFLKNLVSFFRKDELFFVVEISPPMRVVATEIRADFVKREMSVSRSITYSNLEDFLSSIGKKSRAKIIISLDPAFSATVYSLSDIVRANPSKVIDEAEADNIISYAIRKFINEERVAAASRMGADLSDMVVADIKVRNINIDGHQVVSGIGLAGKVISLGMSGTFVLRALDESMNKLFAHHAVCFIAERTASIARLVFESRRHIDKKSFFVVDVSDNSTNILKVGHSRMAYHDDFPWGHSALKKAIADHYLIGDDIAIHISKTFNSGRSATRDFFPKINSLVAGEYNIFFNGLNKIIQKHDIVNVFFRTPYGMPDIITKAKIKNIKGRYAKLEVIPQDAFRSHFDFVIQLKKGVQSDTDYLVSHIIDYYLGPTEKFFNELAARHLRWLKRN